jgi:hypothetical protein
MLKRALTIAMLAGLFGPISASAQTTTCGRTTLSCLLPTAFHTNPPTFNFFNEAFGTQIGQLPLATPASGFTFTFDKATGVYKASTESFGPLLAERAETIGRHKAYLAFTYQRFTFSELDGNDLDRLPILFNFPSQQTPTVITSTQNRVDAKVDQYVAFGTFGLTDRIDIAVAIPFEGISMGVSSRGTEYSTRYPANASFAEFVPGSANGIGDLVASAKGTLLKRGRYGLALGAELRFPTGDERNFLGSGAFGVKPYVVLSHRGKIAPHVNLGYQWNGNSSLAIDASGRQQHLPGYFSYVGGADIGLTKRITVVADLVGQYFFDAPQVSTPRSITAQVNGKPTSFPSLVLVNDSYKVNNLSVGLKGNPWGHFLVSANALVKLDEGGLRAKVVPLVGLSYSF